MSEQDKGFLKLMLFASPALLFVGAILWFILSAFLGTGIGTLLVLVGFGGAIAWLYLFCVKLS